MPAYIYPGQGSQSVGMGKALAASSPQAAAVWRQADEALGEALSRLAWEGPAEQLDQTVNAQPALLAASIAAQRALDAQLGDDPGRFGPPSYYAGHSMGQYSAMVAAGVLDLGRCDQAGSRAWTPDAGLVRGRRHGRHHRPA